jgi:hypothetical protein
MTTIFNPTYETLLEFIELRSCKGSFTPIAHFVSLLHAKKLHETAILSDADFKTIIGQGPDKEITLHVRINDSNKAEVMRIISNTKIPVQYPQPLNIWKKIPSVNDFFSENQAQPRGNIEPCCPFCGSPLIMKKKLICINHAFCPALGAQPKALKEHYNYRLEYPMWVFAPDLPRFIHACNIFGCFAMPNPDKKAINNTIVIAPHEEFLGRVGYYIGTHQNEKDPFERMSTDELIAMSKSISPDYEYEY